MHLLMLAHIHADFMKDVKSRRGTEFDTGYFMVQIKFLQERAEVNLATVDRNDGREYKGRK